MFSRRRCTAGPHYRATVIVLVGQVSSASRLLSLNTATGAVRWVLALGKQGETGDLTLTGDGGLAMTYGFATLTVVDLTTGKVRWGRTAGNSSGPLAVGGVVIDPAGAVHGQTSGRLLGFSSRTGRSRGRGPECRRNRSRSWPRVSWS